MSRTLVGRRQTLSYLLATGPWLITLSHTGPACNLRLLIRHVLVSSFLYGEIALASSPSMLYKGKGDCKKAYTAPLLMHACYGPPNRFGPTTMPACFLCLAVGARRPVSCRQETQDRSTVLHDRTDQRPTPRRNVRGRRAKGFRATPDHTPKPCCSLAKQEQSWAMLQLTISGAA